MFDRTKVVEKKLWDFLNHPNGYDDPLLKKDISQSLGKKLVDIFESQLTSRLLDFKARELRSQGKSFYTIGSSGHEGMAVIGEVSRLSDMAFLHYRDAAFQIQRSKKRPGHTIIHDMLLSFCASSEDPISGGRHKVLGSKELSIPPQTSTIASHLPKAVGAAFSINKALQLRIEGQMPSDSVVITSFGDASLNHASAQTALNCAHWLSYQLQPLPLLFICEDNGIGISTKTPIDWVKASQSTHTALKYFECDGLDILDALEASQSAFDYVREHKKPAFLRFKTVRLMGHAGSDIEAVYRSSLELDQAESLDPIIKTASILLANNIISSEELQKISHELKQRIDRVAVEILNRPKLSSAMEVMSSVIPSIQKRISPALPSVDERKDTFGSEWEQISQKFPMAKLINMGLSDILLRYPEAVVFGEDVAKKGGVYNVTANLEARFGKNKVFNSLLDETNILGTAIGLAHNNILPIPEIQFLAYVHNAEDQIRGEAATLSFFSNMQYTNGMVIRIAGLGYQKGFGGHFHNDNSISIFRDIPGLIIAIPSNGKDAVMMMRTAVKQAYEFGRVVVFIEPIALYPVKDLHQDKDNLWSFEYPQDQNLTIELGEFGVTESEKELCLISYGNGHYLSQQAAKILKDQYGVNPTLIDLRWIAPLNEEKLSQTLSQFKHVLVVEECRKTGSLSEEIMTLMQEKCKPLPKVSRIASYDVFIPLADAANLVLIQKDDIVKAAMKLLGKESSP